MQRDRPQTLLDEAGLHIRAQRVEVGEIDERLGLNLAILADDPDAAGSFNNENASRAVIGGRDADRIVKSVGHLDERQLWGARNFSAWLCNVCRRPRNLLCG